MKAEKPRDAWQEVERALGSIGKLKIIHALLEKPDEAVTKYALEKTTKLKPASVRTGLRALIEAGWIKEYTYQPKTYMINKENELVQHFSDFFREIKHL